MRILFGLVSVLVLAGGIFVGVASGGPEPSEPPPLDCTVADIVDVGSIQVEISVRKPELLTNEGCYDAIVTLTFSYEGKFLYTAAYRYGHVTLHADQRTPAGLRTQLLRPAGLRVAEEIYYPKWAPLEEMYEASNTWTDWPEARFNELVSNADEIICYAHHYEGGVCVSIFLDRAIGRKIWEYGN